MFILESLVSLFRPKLTLNLEDIGVGSSGSRQRPGFGSMALNLNIGNNVISSGDMIDISLPLERQG